MAPDLRGYGETGGPAEVDRPKVGLSAPGDLAGPWESCCLSGEADGVLGGA